MAPAAIPAATAIRPMPSIGRHILRASAGMSNRSLSRAIASCRPTWEIVTVAIFVVLLSFESVLPLEQARERLAQDVCADADATDDRQQRHDDGADRDCDHTLQRRSEP